MPHSSTRVPETIGEINDYINRTATHLVALFNPPITAGIAKSSTKTLFTGDYRNAMQITIENTGADVLNFCTHFAENTACDPVMSIEVSPGTPQTRSIQELGGEQKRNLNCTNPSAAVDGSCKVTFPLNWKRLGFLEDDLNGWLTFRQRWNEKHTLASNPATANKTNRAERRLVRKEFGIFSEPLLTLMEGNSTLTQTDRNVFNIPAPDRQPTRRGKINNAPDAALSPLEGGEILQRLRHDTDRTRASIHPLADGWKRFWKIVGKGDKVPKNHTECDRIDVGSKALSIFRPGTEHDGKKIYAFYQWVNLTNSANDGPVSPVTLVTISAGTPE